MQCTICKVKEFDLAKYEWVKDEPSVRIMFDMNCCSSCGHDMLTLREVNDGGYKIAIVNRTVYRLAEEFDGPGFRGFGGAEFRFLFSDGHVEICRNVWCPEKVSPTFEEALPDNAVILPKEVK